MKFQSVKGTRDFYPAAMRLRNWITETWRRVSLRNGFEEYDAPIFEYLDLLTIKSGEEIAEQLFSFTDRGGRNLAIRPEITPSLARMVNAKINSLPRPIKWFSIPRLCRAENPQRGRLREFFQWNIDIIGSDDVLADAECVFVAVDALRELKLTKDDVVIRYASRELLTEVLRSFEIAEDAMERVMMVLDKRSRLPEKAFQAMLQEAVPKADSRMGILRFMNMKEIGASAADSIAKNVGMATSQKVVEAVDKLQRFQKQLESFGITDWCEYDTNIIRGLAYYTGIVYEVFDAGQSMRAIAGGGRFDDLLEVLGGPKIGATGFGMADVVLGILLEEKDKVPKEVQAPSLEFFVIDGGDGLLEKVMQVVGALRRNGISADFSYSIERSLSKQLKEANKRNAKKAVMVRADGVAVKDLATGKQEEMSVERFLAQFKNGS
ncbi:MAG: histidine--tRNA ligase [Phycisphaerae bacterium]|nr:histidine--tRNA ligase [Phycisphaerae bacterium]